MGYEYRSLHTLWGLPWLHVAFGVDPFTGKRRVARGVVAIGEVAVGGVAVGGVAIGGIAIGQLGVGVLFALGQLALAIWAVGQAAAGALGAAGQLALAPDPFAMLEATAHAAEWTAAMWFAVAAVAAILATRARHRVARLVTPSAFPSIRDARPGEVVLRGRVVPLGTVEAPVSKRACVGYDVRRLRADRPPRAERNCEDFVIDDGSSRARVVAADTTLLLEPVRAVATGVETRLVAHGSAAASAGRGRQGSSAFVRPVGTAIERVLLPGDAVVVAGRAMGLAGRAAGNKVRLVVHGGDGGPVLVTNRVLDELRAELGVGLAVAVGLVAAAIATLVFFR